MNTMNRWIAFPLAVLAACAVQAQVVRMAPADVQPARLVVTAPPNVTLDGKADRLSPGARIRNTQNLQVLSGTIVGQDLPVVFRRDGAGLVHEVWVLSEDEYSRVGGLRPGSAEDRAKLAELLNAIFGRRK
jgi:hypothetical protein